MSRRKSVDDHLVHQIKDILRAHPEYGHTRVARELAARGIGVELFRLRQLLKEIRRAPGGRQRWAESPLDPGTWRNPPPRYIG
jgi:hypothetical protein